MNPLEVYDKYLSSWSDIGLHLPWLRENARGNVLEIGVREGISTAALLLGVGHSGGHVWSVDLEDCSHLYNDPYHWTFIQSDSGNSDAVLEKMGLRDDSFKIDLLLVDGNHTYTGCMADLAAYAPWAKVIAIHDTNSKFIGVWEAMIAYFRSPHNGGFSKAEFRTQSNGLGVLYR